MRRIVDVLTAAMILVASASASHAANDAQRCDSAKTKAVAKMFKDSIQCNHRAQFDLSFDLTDCRTDAYNRCTLGITRADSKFSGACFFTANFDVCNDALNAANAIYPNV
jgi:hypothetical protein